MSKYKYKKENYIKNKTNDYYKNKYKNKCIIKSLRNKRIRDRKIDTIHKIYNNLMSRIYITFSKHNFKFIIPYKELIGCNTKELKDFISKNLKDDMTFENYGEWEIDHIRPVSKFNLNNRNELFECFNYTNLQPLWKSENRKKYNHF